MRLILVNELHRQLIMVALCNRAHHYIFGIQSKRPIVKTSHSQNVPYSKRPQSKCPLFEAKRPRRSKRPKAKRTDVIMIYR